VACKGKDLRATLRGDRHQVKTGADVRFRLSIVNASEKACTVSVNPKNYQLKIYSGTDRIWSSRDCARLVPTIRRIVKPEQDVAWTMTWNGKRSRQGADCATRPETPRPGYYYATSQLDGVDPVQYLIILR
jgi:hypothetical protein